MSDESGGVRRRLTTVTVSTNERDWLTECLAGLTASELGDELDLEVLVVDNASTDGSGELVADRFPGVRLISSDRNLGFAEANNLGIRDALSRGSDYIFLVNPDTRTPPDLIRRLVDFLRDCTDYGIVGPLQYRYTDDGSPTTELNEWSVAALTAGEGDVFALDGVSRPSPAGPCEGRAPRTLEHAYVQGSALLCRADVIHQVGDLDPSYHTYYEETDLCRRARWGGWRVALLLDLGLQHFGGGSTGRSTYRRRHMQRNKFYFLFTDPQWRGRETWRLSLRWIGNDLACRGAAPAGSRAEALIDSVLGWAWLITRAPRIIIRRRAHRALYRASANPSAGRAISAGARGAAAGDADR
jgi:GT2 family glycosyltransferase